MESIKMEKSINRYRPQGYSCEVINTYGIQVFYQETPYPAAIYYRGKSGKNCGHYRYTNVDQMKERIEEFIQRVNGREKEKEAERAKKKELNAGLRAKDFFAVGDIVVNSWGWEQTNVDFYQVTEVLNKKIRVREIYAEMTEYTQSMAGMCTPIKDKFGEVEYLLGLKLWAENDIHICSPKSYYYFRKWSGCPEYVSWYA